MPGPGEPCPRRPVNPGVDEQQARRSSRPLIFLAVLALHGGVLALLLTGSRTLGVAMSTEHPVEVLFLPPTAIPKVRALNIRPQPVRTNVAVGLAPPALVSSDQSSPAAAPEGRGSAVNWGAEAHRALRAFEIRRDAPPSSAQSVSSSRDDWWPLGHEAGDRYKTASGDWIVWIDSNCYEVARWHSTAGAAATEAPQTICTPPNGGPSQKE